LDQGADPNEAGYEGATPLICAAVQGEAGVVAALLDRGAEIDRGDETSSTALIHAIGMRNDDVVDLLLSRGADPSVRNWLAFHRAVQSGRVPLVKRLLNMGAHPDLQEADELTPLMVAVGRGDLKMVKVLLKAGADPQKTAQKGLTTLDLAIQGKHSEIVKLLEKRVAASARSLLAAVQARDARMVEKLVRQGVPVNVREAEFGYTPLSWAAERGSTRIVRCLVAAGADLEARDFFKQTPLWTAVLNDDARIVRVLLDAGADCSVRDRSGDTLLQSAIWSESTRSIRLLIEAGADVNAVAEGTPAAIHWAVAKGSAEMTDLLIQAGADLNVGLPGGRNNGIFSGFAPGSTPLMMAARQGNLDLVNRLLAAGADWGRNDSEGRTAVDLATRAGRVEILQRLEQAGAKVNFKSRQLHSAALLEAVKRQDVEGVRRAIAGGARTNLHEKDTQRTPLMLACLDGNAEIVRLLLEAKADPNEHTQWGGYPLTNAVVRGHTEAVRALLEAGAETIIEYEPRSVPSGKHNCAIPSRFSPLADAVAGGHAEITEMLLAAGADPNAVSRHGDSPLLAAVTSRHFDLARRLLQAGAVPRAEDADYLDLLQWEARADSDSYRESLAEVRALAGVEPEPVASLPGTFSFRFVVSGEEGNVCKSADKAEAILNWSKRFNENYASLAERVHAVIDELRGRIAERGFHLLDAGMPLGCGPMSRFLVLVPAADPFAVMAAFGTYGNDAGLSNRDLIARFREFEKENPFALRACKYDTIEIELHKPLDDPKRGAQKLSEFRADSCTCDNVGPLEKQLETATRIHFWWD
jgi:ankyrin repeat protein